MSGSVLDASAMLAYLTDEKGANLVRDAIDEGACLSTVNWAEVLSILVDRGQTIEAIEQKLVESGLIGEAIELLLFTPDDAKEVARLRRVTKSHGLSLGDRACLALGVRLKLPVLTADRNWRHLKLNLTIKYIR